MLSRTTKNKVKKGEYFLFTIDICEVSIYNVNCKTVL